MSLTQHSSIDSIRPNVDRSPSTENKSELKADNRFTILYKYTRYKYPLITRILMDKSTRIVTAGLFTAGALMLASGVLSPLAISLIIFGTTLYLTSTTYAAKSEYDQAKDDEKWKAVAKSFGWSILWGSLGGVSALSGAAALSPAIASHLAATFGAAGALPASTLFTISGLSANSYELVALTSSMSTLALALHSIYKIKHSTTEIADIVFDVDEQGSI